MKTNRLLAALLCICLAAPLFSPAISAQGDSPEPCGCGKVIEVIVKGYMHPLYYNEGKWYQIKAGPLSHILVNRRGESILPVTKTWKIDPGQDHTQTPAYEFLYDYRIDPFEAAALLDEFINALCEATGHLKVALVGTSYGANVVMTYLSQYGADRLDTFILINGTFQGTSFAGDVMTGKFSYSALAYINFLSILNENSRVLRFLANQLYRLPFIDFKMPAGPVFRWFFRTAVLRWMRNMPSLWSFLPASYYNEAIQVLDDYPEQTERRKLTDKYVSQVQSQAGRLLREAKEAGVKVAIIASYGKAPIPLMGDTNYQCDMMVDLAYASGGATVAPMGQTLPPDDSPYRSPDGIVDASTCMLPDQTWFIAENWHNVAPAEALRQWIIYSEACPSIADHPEFPQFLRRVDLDTTEPMR